MRFANYATFAIGSGVCGWRLLKRASTSCKDRQMIQEDTEFRCSPLLAFPRSENAGTCGMLTVLLKRSVQIQARLGSL